MRLSTITLVTGIFFTSTLAGCQTDVSLGTNTSRPPTRVAPDAIATQARPSEDEPVRYMPPTLSERLALQEVLDDLYGALEEPEYDVHVVQGALTRAGFRAQLFSVDTQRWLLLFEGGASWRGAGAYLFRLGPAEPIIIQAPHGYHDRHTADIALEVFRRTTARGVFFNTAHRYRAHPAGRASDRYRPADLAHTTDSFFYLVSTEFLKRRRDATIVQLHGFDDAELSERNVDVVISDGTSSPGAQAEVWASRLADALGKERVALYGRDTRKYAASSNTLARWVKTTRYGHFVHVELSPDLRQSLLQDISPLSQTFVR